MWGTGCASPCQELRGGRCCPARSACCSLRYSQPACPDRGSPPSRWETRNQKPTSFPCFSSVVAGGGGGGGGSGRPLFVVSELLSWRCCRQESTTFRTQETGCVGAKPALLLGGAKHTGTCSSRNGFLLCLSQRCYFVSLFRIFGSIDFLSGKQWIFQPPLFITLLFLRCV